MFVLDLQSRIMGTSNSPSGFHDPDKKLACQINIVSVFAPLSASIGLFSSTAFLCRGKARAAEGDPKC